MGRKLVLDANVVDQINRGNADAANALSKMRRNGDTVYISQQAYNELVTQPAIPRTGAANKEFLKDANIEIAPAGPMAKRVDVYAGNQTKTGTVLSEEDARVAAQASAIGAEVWSFDRAYRNNANAVRNLGVKVAPECDQIGLVSGQTPADYRVGRRLMSFAPIEVSVSGYVTRTGPSGGKGGVYSASVGVPEGLPEVGGPSPRGQAIVGGIVLVLEGINIVLNIINDNIQKKKANDALDKERAAIGQARSSRPFSAAAAMVFPIDDWAETVFSYIAPTEDSSGTLNNYINFRMIRWVRAENIHLLKFF